METTAMGRVITAATIENLEDLWAAERGLCKAEEVRRVQVSYALIVTGATLLSLPSSLIKQLGLKVKAVKHVMSRTGLTEANIYGTVRLTIQGRECPIDVTEVPDGMPVLIGQIPLGYLDLIVDPPGSEYTFELN